MLETQEKAQNRKSRARGIRGNLPATKDRAPFWAYCRFAARGARNRSSKLNAPCLIDKYYIDELLVQQQWRCAVSGIALRPPRQQGKHHRDPFGPSLDRIDPELGYVPGNLRIVCNIVNMSINEWGLETLMELAAALTSRKGRQ